MLMWLLEAKLTFLGQAHHLERHSALPSAVQPSSEVTQAPSTCPGRQFLSEENHCIFLFMVYFFLEIHPKSAKLHGIQWHSWHCLCHTQTHPHTHPSTILLVMMVLVLKVELLS